MSCESCAHWWHVANPDPNEEPIPWGECQLNVEEDPTADHRTGTLTRSTYTCPGYTPK